MKIFFWLIGIQFCSFGYADPVSRFYQDQIPKIPEVQRFDEQKLRDEIALIGGRIASLGIKPNLTSRPTSPDHPLIYGPLQINEMSAWIASHRSEILQLLAAESGGLGLTPPKQKQLLEYYATLINLLTMNLRWSHKTSYLENMISSRTYDLRAFLKIGNIEGFRFRLQEWDHLSPALRTEMRVLIQGLCMNSIMLGHYIFPDACATRLSEHEKAGELVKFFDENVKFPRTYWKTKLLPSAEILEKTQVTLQEKVEQRRVFTLPFLRPENECMQRAIESASLAWKSDRSELKIHFREGKDVVAASLVLEPGATAHVKLESEPPMIVLNEKEDCTDPKVIRTISHEIGHLLGFSDCYQEFYDIASKQAFYFALDPENIMCDSGGTVKEFHFENIANALKSKPALK